MSLLDVIRYRAKVWFQRRSHQREMDEEVQFHLSLEAMQRAHDAPGSLSARDAEHAARRRFGNVTYQQEEIRHVAGLGWLDPAVQDVRFALRSFGRAPGFTAVAVATLAIGIGANVAIFSAVNTMLIRPLPFPDPDRLMQVSMTKPEAPGNPARDRIVWSYPKFRVFRENQKIFRDLGLYTELEANVLAGGDPERVPLEIAGAGYLATLGIAPALGRNFSADEDKSPGGAKVVLLSDRSWKRWFNADPSVIGKPIVVWGQPYTIIGVLPERFEGLSGRAALVVSLMSTDVEELNGAWSHTYSLVGRLEPNVTVDQAKEAVKALGAQVDRAFPAPENASIHWGAVARGLDTTRVDPVVRRSLLVLLGAVGLVLLIACANVASLFLVRATGRRREIAVRLAIGAGRLRLVRQLMTESLLLAAGGGIAAIMVAWGGVRLLATLNPAVALGGQIEGLGMVTLSAIKLDLPALTFAGALVVVTGLLFGLAPALRATSPSLTAGLKEGTVVVPRQHLVGVLSGRNALAVAEIALALVLLAGSGLMLRSLRNLLQVDPGFESRQVLTLRLNTRADLGRDSMPGLYDRLLGRLGAIPGVTNAGLLDCPPLNGGCNTTEIYLRDRPAMPDGQNPDVGVHWITPDWPKAAGVGLRRGRLFNSGDRLGTQKVVLVSETAAKKFWPGQDPVGRPVGVGQGGFWKDTAYVAGVLGDVRFGTLDSLPKADVYLPYYQSPRSRMMIFLKTAENPLALSGVVRSAVHDVATDSPIYDLRTLESRTADAAAQARFSATLLALFAGLALSLAALGIYGVVSFAVSQRTREIGIRTALGAARSDVIRLVVGQGLGLAIVGGGIGLVLAGVSTRVLRSLLFDVSPGDPVTFVGIGLLLGGATLLASWIPARRASGVAPVEALRNE